MFRWTYGCVDYIPTARRFLESVFVCIMFSYTAYWSYLKLKVEIPRQQSEPVKLRQAILVVHSFVFGIEFGFKLATSTLIWILNPCHIITVLQILLLASSSPTVTNTLFRLHVHMMNGPLLALTFPILNTRFLPFERVTYFIQHFLIVLIPVCFANQSSEFCVEPLDDLSWVIFALSTQVLYHFLILQPIALLTGANLNNILCPAISDPFPGPNYRVWAVFHQSIIIFVFGKILTLFLLRLNAQEVPWSYIKSSKNGQNSVVKRLLESSSSNISTWYWTNLFRYNTYIFENSAKTDRSNNAE
ncbi:unnamed protein product [Heterobilharzia americana]|nr:unnamed protein product [Heterobilharzia americana]